MTNKEEEETRRIIEKFLRARGIIGPPPLRLNERRFIEELMKRKK